MNLSRKIIAGHSTAVGLDVGSSCVRAAELSIGRRGVSLRRYGQVGLPEGVVVDGEVVDPAPVAVAIRRLWAGARFGSRKVVLALSGQRVIVRQVEVPTMSRADFCSALRYQAEDLIPIPLDDAVLDFAILASNDGDGALRPTMRVLVAAAPRDLVAKQAAVLGAASLRAVAVDPAPMALLRASRRVMSDQRTVAVVDIGAEVTMVAVREHGELRFSRTLNAGGGDLTGGLADRLGVDRLLAEAMKRQSSVPAGGIGLLSRDEMSPLVGEIDDSLAFFSSQLVGPPLEAVGLTGGPSASDTLVGEVGRHLVADVTLLDSLAGLSVARSGLSAEAAAVASTTAMLATGAAEWAFESPDRRLTLLPTDTSNAADLRRTVLLAGVGVAAAAVAVAAVSIPLSDRVGHERAAAAGAEAQNLTLQRKVAALEPLAADQAAITSRLGLLRTTEAGSIAWSRLLSEIAGAMPAGTRLTALSFADAAGGAGATGSSGGSTAAGAVTNSNSTGTSGSRPSGTTGASDSTGPSSGIVSTGGSAGAGAAIGTVTMTVSGPGAEQQVAQWLRALAHVKGLSSLWVPSAGVAGGHVTFTASASVTTAAPTVARPDTTTGAGS